MASLAIFPAILKVDIKINGIQRNKTNEVVPFSGVKPKLYEINAIGADKATPRTHNKTKFLLPILSTNFGVI